MSLTRQSLEKILRKVETGKLSSRKAFEKLKNLPYETFPFARLDHHRFLRKGFPEAVYAPGKSLPQLEKIIRSVRRSGQPLIVTRLEKKSFALLKRKFPKLRYSEKGRIAYGAFSSLKGQHFKVAVLTGGTSDVPVAEEAAVTLQWAGLEPVRIYDCGVAGLHRLLDQMPALQQVQVVICVAGMEGALASVVSGLIDKPVIAVPTSVGYGASFKGIAPLLTMLNSCAPGVAVVNIDNGFGAACFAASLMRAGTGETPAPFQRGRIILLETNLDDMSPQGFELLYERLFRAGALDVWVEPILMKKMRPAFKLSVLLEHRDRDQIAKTVFKETPTLGVRFLEVDRFSLSRKIKRVRTRYGTLRMKLGFLGPGFSTARPEYEDVARIARLRKLPFKDVYRRLLFDYHRQAKKETGG